MKAIKRKLCAILCAAVLVGVLTPMASAATFSDVSNHWAAGYIKTCADLGIVDGIGGGRFNPDGPVTNAQFIKMLCAAFYSAEEQTFENENRAAINTYFGSSIQWYAGKSYYFEKMGLLTNVSYNIQSSASANQPMTRNNMAQVAANVLAQKGIAANESDKSLAQATLMYVNDYYSIPEDNRDAVKTCYALGVITGTDGGKFDGGNTMTRAQACTVITRLLDMVGKTPDPDPFVTPTPDVPSSPKDIQVTTTANAMLTNIADGPYRGTAHNVVDNGFPTGRLNNGKEINETNIAELLDKAKEIWPTGMTWSNAATNNNWYGNSSEIAKNAMLSNGVFASANGGCSGFASMISHYLFGKTGNPVHVVTNFSDLRPGDVVVRLNADKTVDHVMIVVGYYYENGAPTRVFTADGNASGKVEWPTGTSKWYAADENSFTSYGAGSYVALSRWPQ